MELIDYRKASSKFRRLSSNLLVTTSEDGNLHLIRLKKFIDSDPIIKKIISENISIIEFDYKSNDFISLEDGYWAQVNQPIDEDQHMKAIYDYMTDMTKEEKDLRGISSRFHHDSNKYTDKVRHYIDIVFKPLIDYIVSILSEEMMYLESKNDKNSGVIFNQTIGNNYGATNFAQGDITSTNTVTVGVNEKEDIKSLIAEISSMIKGINIDEDMKEDALDELEVIQEQVEDENPKPRRIRKACEGISNFITKLPSNIEKSTLIVGGLTKLLENIDKLEVMLG
ncbi:MAG: hypothetical protein ACRCW0_09000 [Clostridium sp.]